MLSILALLATLGPASTPIPAGLHDIDQLPSDPAPASITNDTHYIVSNERRLDLFADAATDRHDVYVGVGAGQNYVLAGWAKPSFVVLIDFDRDVVDLHGLYVLFLAYAETPKQFERLWSEAGSETATQLIKLGAGDPARTTRQLALYARVHEEVARHLDTMHTKLEEARQAWYLDDPEQYDHIANLARRGRIVARRGDFTQDGVVARVGEALRSSGARVGTLYLSNIEQYFMYGKTYRANILGLPLDDRSITLRTLPARPAGFEYITQHGDDTHAWLKRKRTTSVYRVRGLIKGDHLVASTLFEAGAPPP